MISADAVERWLSWMEPGYHRAVSRSRILPALLLAAVATSFPARAMPVCAQLKTSSPAS